MNMKTPQQKSTTQNNSKVNWTTQIWKFSHCEMRLVARSEKGNACYAWSQFIPLENNAWLTSVNSISPATVTHWTVPTTKLRSTSPSSKLAVSQTGTCVKTVFNQQCVISLEVCGHTILNLRLLARVCVYNVVLK